MILRFPLIVLTASALTAQAVSQPATQPPPPASAPASQPSTAPTWQAKAGPLKTRWAADVAPDKVHPEYPRPQMVRPDWLNLNGLWDLALRPVNKPAPGEFDQKILVPFPVESALSGVMQPVDEKTRVWYRRAFEVPREWSGRRVLLHFGAVDYSAEVWINGRNIGAHQGGYFPFALDITDALRPGGPQDVVVSAWDPTDTGYQPRGKQVLKPSGIWYTATTGIWQTVWLEPVPAQRIENLQLTPEINPARVRVAIDPNFMGAGNQVEVIVRDGDREVGRATGGAEVDVSIPDARLWAPQDPFLYDLTINLRDPQKPDRVIDSVQSYVGVRKISVAKDKNGITRIHLNGEPLFMFGPLDQGFWPDGLYTAPTDEALRYDIEMTRNLGFNMARKHVKIESERWYYWCDRLGLLVWQDMPSGDTSPGEGKTEITRTQESAQDFEFELRALIESRRNHPSIVVWVPYNESWGQWDTKRMVELIRRYDSTRLVDSASGWNDVGAGDMHDIHVYPGPGAPQPEEHRAAVLGEFGGLGLPLEGHTWQSAANWGYRSFTSRADLTEAYLNLLTSLHLLIGTPGLSAAVYTQTTDVEIEVNGLMTYDRALVKPDADRVRAANLKMYGAPPTVKVLVPTSRDQGQTWRYTTEKPADDWAAPSFDAARWSQGPGGLGREGTPGLVVRTPWETADIWARRDFELAAVPASPLLSLYHDEDCEVYINGQLVAKVPGYVTDYTWVPLADKAALKAGRNTLAVHCHQTGGGQGIDVGLVEVAE